MRPTCLINGYVSHVLFPKQGVSVFLPWPWWCKVVAVAMILSSVLWIPGMAVARLLGFSALKEEAPAFFPAEELREEHGIITHKTTPFERVVLGFRD